MSYYSNNNYHSNSNHHNNSGRSGGYNHSNSRRCGGTSANYVWQVSWYNHNCDQKYKAFTNKQQALIFMSKLKSNWQNYCVDLEKYFG